MNVRQLSPADRLSIRDAADYTCHYCARRGGLERDPDGFWWCVDHKTPRVLGGTNDADNLALACFCCNAAKRDLPYEQFIDRCLDGEHAVSAPVVAPAPSRAVREARARRADRAIGEYMGALLTAGRA